MLSKIFNRFLTYKNPLFGGDGSFFVGDYTKTVSETVLVEFAKELKVCIYNNLLFVII